MSKPNTAPKSRLASIFGLLKAVFTLEKLPEAPPPDASPKRRVARAARWIFSIDPLPMDPQPDPEHRKGWLSTVLGFEKLPLDPAEPSRPSGSHVFRWLLGVEKLDSAPAPERSSKK